QTPPQNRNPARAAAPLNPTNSAPASLRCAPASSRPFPSVPPHESSPAATPLQEPASLRVRSSFPQSRLLASLLLRRAAATLWLRQSPEKHARPYRRRQ